ncbi:helix-turn-helix transcriptional regulator [Actinocorallia longicatena]|uniref:Helix-turn-helix transcriptional regulator n=1 Tax=Actinocorallia longicatena TaxID=111803 RepID=A0ABP6QS90_9ACTN
MTVRESVDPMSSMWAWLAYDLWFYRTQRKLSLAQTALIVRVTRGTVSNWEAQRGRPSIESMHLLDEAWNTGGHFKRLHSYAREGHDPNWFKQYVQYEIAAEVLKIFNGKNVPLLVQTEEYGQAVLRIAGRSREEIEAASAARVKRQEIVDRPTPPRLWILIDQEVLECPVGSSAIMRKQCEHLLALVERPRCSIRVVPRSVGWHPGHDGPFQVLRVHGRELAYVGAQAGGRLIEAGADADFLAVRFEEIGALAESRAASIDLIARIMRTYE